MRTNAREAAFKIIFASMFTGEVDNNLAGQAFRAEKLSEDDIAYAQKILDCVSARREEFSEILDKYSHAFPESRIFPADKSVLFLALAEINYMDDIPRPVSVNEAANIASKYSSEKSASFVSGILSEIIKEN